MGLVCLIGAAFLWKQSVQTGSSRERPGIVPGAGGPPTLIFKVKTGKPLTPPADKDWATATNPTYEYWFEYPTRDWTLSVPAEYADSRARLLESKKSPSLAIVVIPFGTYDQDEKAEIEKAENGYLGPNTRDADRLESQADRKIYWRSYACTPPGSDEVMYAQAAFVVAKPKCFAIFMRGTEADMKSAQAIFDRVVKSLHLEKMPLRQDKGKPSAAPSGAPAGEASRAPSGSASTAPPPSPAASPMPAAVNASPSPAPASPATTSASPQVKESPAKP